MISILELANIPTETRWKHGNMVVRGKDTRDTDIVLGCSNIRITLAEAGQVSPWYPATAKDRQCSFSGPRPLKWFLVIRENPLGPEYGEECL